jgi:hypothetical protein
VAVHKRKYRNGRIVWYYEFSAAGSSREKRERFTESGFGTRKDATDAEAARRLQIQRESEEAPKPDILSRGKCRLKVQRDEHMLEIRFSQVTAMQFSHTSLSFPRESIPAPNFGGTMHSSTLVATSEAAHAAHANQAEAVARDKERLTLVGQIRVHDSVSPVYAVRSDKTKGDSLLNRFLFRIWWIFGRRLWPCAEPDNRW